MKCVTMSSPQQKASLSSYCLLCLKFNNGVVVSKVATGHAHPHECVLYPCQRVLAYGNQGRTSCVIGPSSVRSGSICSGYDQKYSQWKWRAIAISTRVCRNRTAQADQGAQQPQPLRGHLVRCDPLVLFAEEAVSIIVHWANPGTPACRIRREATDHCTTKVESL